MSIELLEKSECNFDVKQLIEEIDSLKSNINIFSLLIEKQLFA